LKATARKTPLEDCGSPSGERSMPRTPPLPSWKLAIHAGLARPFFARGSLVETEASQRLVEAATLLIAGRGAESNTEIAQKSEPGAGQNSSHALIVRPFCLTFI
jgi:hypothetical protein